MTIIYNEPYYDMHNKEYLNILSCDTTDSYIISLCNRFIRKPISTFQNFHDLQHYNCSYAFKNLKDSTKLMNINNLPELLLLLSNNYDIDYKMSKLLDKHNSDNSGKKIICILQKKN